MPLPGRRGRIEIYLIEVRFPSPLGKEGNTARSAPRNDELIRHFVQRGIAMTAAGWELQQA
ncbi:MAG TPA: hypothetical protein VFW37_14535, partial [Alphaproteobacteria bacterium]|nr:hypothetical protein [Alphaproteobacteria bacterium]